MFVIALLSIFFVEFIYAVPHGNGTSDLEPLFRDDAFVLSKSNDGQKVGSIEIISKYFKALLPLRWRNWKFYSS